MSAASALLALPYPVRLLSMRAAAALARSRRSSAQQASAPIGEQRAQQSRQPTGPC